MLSSYSEETRQPPTLRASAVCLRPYQPEDLSAFVRWMHDPALWDEQAADLPSPEELTEPALTELFHALARGSNEQTFWILADAATNQPVGQASLEQDPRNPSSAEIGLEIPDPQHRGQGAGRQAVELLVQYAFGELKLTRLTARTHSANLAGQKLFESAGFQLVERCPEGLRSGGKPVETWVYERKA